MKQIIALSIWDISKYHGVCKTFYTDYETTEWVTWIAIEKLVECIGRFNNGEIDADTSCQIEKQILTDKIDDPVAQYKPSLNYKDF